MWYVRWSGRHRDRRSCNLALQQLESPGPRPSIHAKIAVERQDSRLLMNFGASNQARVSQRDRSIRVFRQDCLDSAPVIRRGNHDAVHVPRRQSDDLGGPGPVDLAHQKTRLRDDRHAAAKRRLAAGKRETRTFVIDVVFRKERNERSGIEKDSRRIHSPKPSRCLRFTERSRGPFRYRPTLRPARSRALRRWRSSRATSRSPRRTISESVCPVDFFNASSVARSSLLRRAWM
jgi:hypothetical protein